MKWLIVWTSKSLNISIGTVMKNQEMLKFVSDHFKTNKICKHAVKKKTLSIPDFGDSTAS